MKLCKKCVVEIDRATRERYPDDENNSFCSEAGVKATVESDCEFWIHRRYNEYRKNIQAEEDMEL